ncbi:MAG: CPBP family intramembrane metalloprotease [Anaerolineales bacterium]|nr:CPBP family intramembrane metalloprotease [Anaerolineales bacterium]
MSAISISPKAQSLATFLFLALGISWAVWIPAALVSYDFISFHIDPVLSGLLGAMGPSLAALITIALYEGRAGFGDLLKRLLTWRVGLQWYLFVLFWPAALSLTKTGLSILLGSPIPNFGQPPFVNSFPELLDVSPFVFLPAFFLQQLLFGSPMGEEIGWRGFALPRMQFEMSSLRASLLLGLVWGTWHVPLWLTKGNLFQDTFIGWHFLELMATTVLFTWVYNNTRGSLWLALLFHASIGVTGLFLSSAEFHPWIGAALSWGTAALVIGFVGSQRLAQDIAGAQYSTPQERKQLT